MITKLFWVLFVQTYSTFYLDSIRTHAMLDVLHIKNVCKWCISQSQRREPSFFDVASAINPLQPASAATSCTITWGWSISNWTDLQHIKDVQVGLRLFWDHVAFLVWHHLAIQMRVFRTSIWSKKVSVLYQAPMWN